MSDITPPPRTRFEMPFLLLAGMGFSALFAGVALLVMLGFLIMLPMAGSYTLNERTVSRGEFFAAMWPLLVAMPLLSALVGAIAYGLWRERRWARPAMLAYCVLGMVVAPISEMMSAEQGQVIQALVMSAIVAVFGWWYLYRKRNVVAYYRAIAARERVDRTSGGSAAVPTVSG